MIKQLFKTTAYLLYYLLMAPAFSRRKKGHVFWPPIVSNTLMMSPSSLPLAWESYLTESLCLPQRGGRNSYKGIILLLACVCICMNIITIYLISEEVDGRTDESGRRVRSFLAPITSRGPCSKNQLVAFMRPNYREG